MAIQARLRPRLLYVSGHFLFPANDDASLRTVNILRQLKGGMFEVTLASPAPPDADRFAVDTIGVCDHFRSWPTAQASRVRRVLDLVARAPVSAAGGARVVAAALAENPDVVVVDSPEADRLLTGPLPAASVLFARDAQAEVLARCRSVVADSPQGAAALRQRHGHAGIWAIGTGVDLDHFAMVPADAAPQVPPDGGTIVFAAAMDSPGNDFLMDQLWPLLLRERPAARAVIIGTDSQPEMLDAVRSRNLAWTVTTPAADIRPHLAQSHLCVVPSPDASGIDVLQAMAMGRPVVATTAAVAGLDITPEEHFLAADSAEDFAIAILRLLADRSERNRIALAARARLEARFSWAHVARRFEAICAQAMAPG